MKRITKEPEQGLRSVVLYLENVNEIIEVFRAHLPESTITIADDDAIYDSIEDMAKHRGKTPKTLTLSAEWDRWQRVRLSVMTGAFGSVRLDWRQWDDRAKAIYEGIITALRPHQRFRWLGEIPQPGLLHIIAYNAIAGALCNILNRTIPSYSAVWLTLFLP
jgi:hypothetical protein